MIPPEAHAYGPTEWLILIVGTCTALTTMIVTIINTVRTGKIRDGQVAQNIQLNSQDHQLTTIKEQTNGGQAKLQAEVTRLSIELEALKSRNAVQ